MNVNYITDPDRSTTNKKKKNKHIVHHHLDLKQVCVFPSESTFKIDTICLTEATECNYMDLFA